MNPSWLPTNIKGAILYYQKVLSSDLSEEALREAKKKLVLGDLFYLLVYILGRKDMLHPWLFARCREVQANPNGYLDLWAREHGKSSIITVALTMQNILQDAEITIGIFSHNKAMAKSFLRVIKQEFETNTVLQDLFPEVLYKDPQKSSRKWSEDVGLIVRRTGNPPEATLEAHGLIDSMPTGRHFQLRVYDDLVTPEAVSTPEQMRKVIDALDMSSNLGRKGGVMRMIGTRYRLGDAYEEYIKRGVVKPRIYPATDNGRPDGVPVLFSEAEWDNKLRDMSPAIVASQMLQNPLASSSVIFQPDWIKLWPYYVKNNAGEIRRDDEGKPIQLELPAFEMVFLSLDGAFSTKTSADDSCILTIGLWKATENSPKYSVMVCNVFMEQVDYPTLRDEVLWQYGNKFGRNAKAIDGIIVENKSSGSALIPELRKAGLSVYPYNPGQLDKVARANLVSPHVRDGYVYTLESNNEKRQGYPMNWLGKWYEQILYFPNVTHDDGVDSLVQALSVLDKMGYLRGKVAPPRDPEFCQKSEVGSYG